MSPEEAIDTLKNYWAFKDSSMVMIGSETDMFMSARNIRYLTEFVRLYDQEKITNPLSLSTKCFIPDEFIEFVQSLQNAKIIFYVSYSGLPKEIEPHINHERMITNFRRLAEAKQRIIHFWRPMLPQNSSIEKLTEVAENVHQYASCSVVRGLNLNPKLQQGAWYWPEARDAEIDFSKTVSLWPEGSKENISLIMERYAPYPIFYKNSCAMAYVLNRPDFGGVFNSKRCLTCSCPSKQREICSTDHETRTFPSSHEVETALQSINLDNKFEIDKQTGQIEIYGTMDHEHIACLSQMLRVRLYVSNIQTEHEWGGYVLGHEDKKIEFSLD